MFVQVTVHTHGQYHKSSSIILCLTPLRQDVSLNLELVFSVLGWEAREPLLFIPLRAGLQLCMEQHSAYYMGAVQTPALMPEQQALLMDEPSLQPLCISFNLRHFIFDFSSTSSGTVCYNCLIASGFLK